MKNFTEEMRKRGLLTEEYLRPKDGTPTPYLDFEEAMRKRGLLEAAKPGIVIPPVYVPHIGGFINLPLSAKVAAKAFKPVAIALNIATALEVNALAKAMETPMEGDWRLHGWGDLLVAVAKQNAQQLEAAKQMGLGMIAEAAEKPWYSPQAYAQTAGGAKLVGMTTTAMSPTAMYLYGFVLDVFSPIDPINWINPAKVKSVGKLGRLPAFEDVYKAKFQEWLDKLPAKLANERIGTVENQMTLFGKAIVTPGGTLDEATKAVNDLMGRDMKTLEKGFDNTLQTAYTLTQAVKKADPAKYEQLLKGVGKELEEMGLRSDTARKWYVTWAYPFTPDEHLLLKEGIEESSKARRLLNIIQGQEAIKPLSWTRLRRPRQYRLLPEFATTMEYGVGEVGKYGAEVAQQARTAVMQADPEVLTHVKTVTKTVKGVVEKRKILDEYLDLGIRMQKQLDSGVHLAEAVATEASNNLATTVQKKVAQFDKMVDAGKADIPDDLQAAGMMREIEIEKVEHKLPRAQLLVQAEQQIQSAKVVGDTAGVQTITKKWGRFVSQYDNALKLFRKQLDKTIRTVDNDRKVILNVADISPVDKDGNILKSIEDAEGAKWAPTKLLVRNADGSVNYVTDIKEIGEYVKALDEGKITQAQAFRRKWESPVAKGLEEPTVIPEEAAGVTPPTPPTPPAPTPTPAQVTPTPAPTPVQVTPTPPAPELLQRIDQLVRSGDKGSSDLQKAYGDLGRLAIPEIRPQDAVYVGQARYSTWVDNDVAGWEKFVQQVEQEGRLRKPTITPTEARKVTAEGVEIPEIEALNLPDEIKSKIDIKGIRLSETLEDGGRYNQTTKYIYLEQGWKTTDPDALIHETLHSYVYNLDEKDSDWIRQYYEARFPEAVAKTKIAAMGDEYNPASVDYFSQENLTNDLTLYFTNPDKLSEKLKEVFDNKFKQPLEVPPEGIEKGIAEITQPVATGEATLPVEVSELIGKQVRLPNGEITTITTIEREVGEVFGEGFKVSFEGKPSTWVKDINDIFTVNKIEVLATGEAGRVAAEVPSVTELPTGRVITLHPQVTPQVTKEQIRRWIDGIEETPSGFKMDVTITKERNSILEAKGIGVKQYKEDIISKERGTEEHLLPRLDTAENARIVKGKYSDVIYRIPLEERGVSIDITIPGEALAEPQVAGKKVFASTEGYNSFIEWFQKVSKLDPEFAKNPEFLVEKSGDNIFFTYTLKTDGQRKYRIAAGAIFPTYEEFSFNIGDRVRISPDFLTAKQTTKKFGGTILGVDIAEPQKAITAEVPPTPAEVKEPWQMTREEFNEWFSRQPIPTQNRMQISATGRPLLGAKGAKPKQPDVIDAVRRGVVEDAKAEGKSIPDEVLAEISPAPSVIETGVVPPIDPKASPIFETLPESVRKKFDDGKLGVEPAGEKYKVWGLTQKGNRKYLLAEFDSIDEAVELSQITSGRVVKKPVANAILKMKQANTLYELTDAIPMPVWDTASEKEGKLLEAVFNKQKAKFADAEMVSDRAIAEITDNAVDDTARQAEIDAILAEDETVEVSREVPMGLLGREKAIRATSKATESIPYKRMEKLAELAKEGDADAQRKLDELIARYKEKAAKTALPAIGAAPLAFEQDNEDEGGMSLWEKAVLYSFFTGAIATGTLAGYKYFKSRGLRITKEGIKALDAAEVASRIAEQTRTEIMRLGEAREELLRLDRQAELLREHGQGIARPFYVGDPAVKATENTFFDRLHIDAEARVKAKQAFTQAIPQEFQTAYQDIMYRARWLGVHADRVSRQLFNYIDLLAETEKIGKKELADALTQEAARNMISYDKNELETIRKLSEGKLIPYRQIRHDVVGRQMQALHENFGRFVNVDEVNKQVDELNKTLSPDEQLAPIVVTAGEPMTTDQLKTAAEVANWQMKNTLANVADLFQTGIEELPIIKNLSPQGRASALNIVAQLSSLYEFTRAMDDIKRKPFGFLTDWLDEERLTYAYHTMTKEARDRYWTLHEGQELPYIGGVVVRKHPIVNAHDTLRKLFPSYSIHEINRLGRASTNENITDLADYLAKTVDDPTVPLPLDNALGRLAEDMGVSGDTILQSAMAFTHTFGGPLRQTLIDDPSWLVGVRMSATKSIARTGDLIRDTMKFGLPKSLVAPKGTPSGIYQSWAQLSITEKIEDPILSKMFANMYFPQDIKQMVDRALTNYRSPFKRYRRPDQQRGLLWSTWGVLDHSLNLMKTQALGTLGYVHMNLISALWQNWMEDTGPAGYAAMIRYGVTKTMPDGVKYSAREFDEGLSAVAASGFINSELRKPTALSSKFTKTVYKAFAEDIAIGQPLPPSVTNWLSQRTETFVRGANMMDKLQKGYSLNDAIRSALHAQYDYATDTYGDLFQYSFKVFPFLKWQINNIPYTFVKLFTQPRKVRMEAFNVPKLGWQVLEPTLPEDVNTDLQYSPKYRVDRMPIPIATYTTETGRKHAVMWMLGRQLPHLDPLALAPNIYTDEWRKDVETWLWEEKLPEMGREVLGQARPEIGILYSAITAIGGGPAREVTGRPITLTKRDPTLRLLENIALRVIPVQRLFRIMEVGGLELKHLRPYVVQTTYDALRKNPDMSKIGLLLGAGNLYVYDATKERQVASMLPLREYEQMMSELFKMGMRGETPKDIRAEAIAWEKHIMQFYKELNREAAQNFAEVQTKGGQ